MLDTMGPALQVCNKSGNPIELMAGNHVTITPDVTREPSAEILPVNYSGLANVSFEFHPVMLFILDFMSSLFAFYLIILFSSYTLLWSQTVWLQCSYQQTPFL